MNDIDQVKQDLLPVEFSWAEMTKGGVPTIGGELSDAATLAAVLPRRYVDAKLLGQGPLFLHFVARDVAHNRWVWIKLFRPELAKDVKRRTQVRTAAAQGLLAIHPSIIRTYDIVDVPPTFFIVQEAAQNAISVHKWHAKTAQQGEEIPTSEVSEMILQVSEALETLHRHGLGMDLTPHHILRCQSGEFKLISIGTSGVALEKLPTDEYLSLVAPGQTQTFTSGDERNSQFTLAAIGYRLLLDKPARPNCRAPHRNAPTIPVGLSKALAKALAANPKSRYATLAKFRAATRKKKLPAYVTLTFVILAIAAVAAGLALRFF